MSLQAISKRPKAEIVKIWFFRPSADTRYIARDECGTPFVEYDEETANETAELNGWDAVETDLRQLLDEKERNDDIRRYLNSPKFSGTLNDPYTHPYVHRNDVLNLLNSY